jgi:hypothetical protein
MSDGLLLLKDAVKVEEESQRSSINTWLPAFYLVQLNVADNL